MLSQKEISELPRNEQLTLMEILWKEISSDESAIEVPQWHKDLLDEREKKIQAGEAKFIDWEDAKRQIDELCK